MKLMFICTGNICRSAMAHAMFEKTIKEKNKDIQVYSCGVSADNGWFCTIEAVETMKKYNIDLKNHRSTNIRSSKIQNMDIILCATKSHKDTVINMYPQLQNKTFTMKEYAGYPLNDYDIKDPWGYGMDVYEKCAKQIKECLDLIIEKM